MSLTDAQRVDDSDKVRRSPEAISSTPDALPDEGDAANVEIQDGGRGSTNPSPALGGSIQQQQQQPQQQISLPVMTNRPPSVTNRPPSVTNRPSSVASNHSVASSSVAGGAPRPTTTSRRGGRARSRSPVSNVGRPGSRTSNRDDFMGVGEAFVPDGRSSRNTTSPANPSSAAAAAAAAAKALSNSRGAGHGHQPPWYDNGRGVENPRYRPQNGFDNTFGGPHNWPGTGGSEDRRVGQRNMGRSYQNVGQGQFKRFEERPDLNNGRYGDQRNSRATDRLTPPVPPGQYNSDRRHRLNAGEDYYQGLGGMAPVNDGPNMAVQSPEHLKDVENIKRPGSTSRVIGTPTPIHVPRAADAPTSARQDGTPSSVFRERPSAGSGTGAIEDDDSPQKILLSLRTPTTSFEEANPKKGAKVQAGAPFSPEAPPRIQNAHQQNQMDATLFFEPQRSPKQQGGTLEMAPSFSLFNQSFDSLGDSPHYLNVGAPLDAAFQSGSFGAGPGGSHDMETGGPQLLPNNNIHRNPSGTGGSFGAAYPPSQPFLGGSASGGVMTFGSPVNSFGNGAPTQSGRRAGNMMLLGGSDARSSSPTQMLSMYPSYSGGYGGGQPYGQSPPFRNRGGLGDNHMRTMSSGSFGGASLLHAYTPRSFGAEGSPPGTFASPQAAPSQDSYNGTPRFYAFLGRHKGAFIKCSFLLPGLKAALLESPISDNNGGEKEGHGEAKALGHQPPSAPVRMGMLSGRGFPDPSPHETAIAMRRVISAVCAFGGTTSADRRVNVNAKTPESSQSIFRKKSAEPDQSTPAAPSSTVVTPPGSRSDSRSKEKYDELLPTRYYENENRLSWEFEESPPVGVDDEDERRSKRKNKISAGGKSGKGGESSKRLKTANDGDDSSKQSDYHDGGKKVVTPGQDQPKMRYRCKLCGQPKQNHTCPYQQSLQRSIGVMVYPAVNAFSASEPGTLAPPLDDMNNFVLGGSESVSSGDGSPSRPTPDRSGAASTQVTPDTLRSGGKGQNSPGSSSLSTGTTTPQGTPFRTPKSQKGDALSARGTPGSANRPKRKLGGSGDGDVLFVDSMQLKPEQFRLVSESKQAPLPADAYTYASLPLPYAQRKRLSDNLFALSKEVPQLTDECAVVLREAREKDMWDLAVAELMTQVVVIIHCRDGDSRFEGLRRYLTTLGISC